MWIYFWYCNKMSMLIVHIHIDRTQSYNWCATPEIEIQFDTNFVDWLENGKANTSGERETERKKSYNSRCFMQWAAVRTNRSLINDPPHENERWFSSPNPIAAMCGNSVRSTFDPPIISGTAAKLHLAGSDGFHSK